MKPWRCPECGFPRIGLTDDPCVICACIVGGHEPTKHRDMMGERTGRCRCSLYLSTMAYIADMYEHGEPTSDPAPRPIPEYERCIECGRLGPIPCPCEAEQDEAERDEFERHS